MRKFIFAISMLALAASAAFADSDRRSQGADEGAWEERRRLVEDGEGRRRISTPRPCWQHCRRCRQRCSKFDVDCAVPGGQRQGRHHGLAEDLGRHGRLQGGQVDKFKASQAATRLPLRASDRRCAQGAVRRDRRRLRQLPPDLSAQERLIVPVDAFDWEARRRRPRSGRRRRVAGGWVLSAPARLDAATLASSWAPAMRPRASGFSMPAAAPPAMRGRNPKARRRLATRRRPRVEDAVRHLRAAQHFARSQVTASAPGRSRILPTPC